MFSKHGTRKISVASASSNLGNNGKVKIALIEKKVAVLVDGEVFWRLLSINFAMFRFNAMVKGMWLRKLQRPLMDIGEDHRRYAIKCQYFQKDEKDAH